MAVVGAGFATVVSTIRREKLAERRKNESSTRQRLA
jgi:hypothetical protein